MPAEPQRIGAVTFWNQELLPELTIDQYRAITEAFTAWLSLKAEHETRWTDEQRACLRQLVPDIFHSSLLHRMIYERRLPLPEPPPLQNAYPQYPSDGEP